MHDLRFPWASQWAQVQDELLSGMTYIGSFRGGAVRTTDSSDPLENEFSRAVVDVDEEGLEDLAENKGTVVAGGGASRTA